MCWRTLLENHGSNQQRERDGASRGKRDESEATLDKAVPACILYTRWKCYRHLMPAGRSAVRGAVLGTSLRAGNRVKLRSRGCSWSRNGRRRPQGVEASTEVPPRYLASYMLPRATAIGLHTHGLAVFCRRDSTGNGAARHCLASPCLVQARGNCSLWIAESVAKNGNAQREWPRAEHDLVWPRVAGRTVWVRARCQAKSSRLPSPQGDSRHEAVTASVLPLGVRCRCFAEAGGRLGAGGV